MVTISPCLLSAQVSPNGKRKHVSLQVMPSSLKKDIHKVDVLQLNVT